MTQLGVVCSVCLYPHFASLILLLCLFSALAFVLFAHDWFLPVLLALIWSFPCFLDGCILLSSSFPLSASPSGVIPLYLTPSGLPVRSRPFWDMSILSNLTIKMVRYLFPCRPEDVTDQFAVP